jgi:hypothetical protein
VLVIVSEKAIYNLMLALRHSGAWFLHLVRGLGQLGSFRERSNLLRTVTLTMFLYGLLVWVYVIVIRLVHPLWLSEPFSHIQFPPFDWRLDEVGMLAFAVSAVGFFIWQIAKKQT